MHRRHAVSKRRKPLPRSFERNGVSVYADQPPRCQTAGNLIGMPRAAQRPVQLNSVGVDLQRFDTLVQQDGFMTEFHQKPNSSITAASASGVRYFSSSAA